MKHAQRLPLLTLKVQPRDFGTEKVPKKFKPVWIHSMRLGHWRYYTWHSLLIYVKSRDKLSFLRFWQHQANSDRPHLVQGRARWWLEVPLVHQGDGRCLTAWHFETLRAMRCRKSGIMVCWIAYTFQLFSLKTASYHRSQVLLTKIQACSGHGTAHQRIEIVEASCCIWWK